VADRADTFTAVHLAAASRAFALPMKTIPYSNLPAGRTRTLAMLLALLAACSPLALLVDMPLTRWAHGRGVPGDLRNVVRFSETFAHGSGVILILVAAVALDPRSWRVLPRLALGAYGSGWLADGLKLIIVRRRPKTVDLNLDVRETFLGFFAWRDLQTIQDALSRDIQSFPSGHAATAAGLACALSRLYPRAAWFFAALTILACLQRVAARAHFLSDVLAGAAVGVLINLLLELPRVRRWLESLETDAG
jgi:membrane-associated phospholipid phosphatase